MAANQNALETFVSQTISLAAAGQLAAGAELVRNALRQGVLRRNAAHLDNVLESLDPQNHGLAYTAVLAVKLSQLPDLANEQQRREAFVPLVEKAEMLAAQIDKEQALAAPEIFAYFYRKLAETALRQGDCEQALSPLVAAVGRLRHSERQLTSIHASALCLALKTRRYADVTHILDTDVSDILQEEQQGPAMDAKFVLLYFYYGGLVYAAMHNFERAMFFFELALSIPAQVLSAIMVESYRKLVLVALVVKGKGLNVGKVCRGPLLKRIQARCPEYVALCKAVEMSKKDGPSKANGVAQQHANAFEQHCNTGLVKLVLESVHRSSVTSLTKTYVTVTLADVVSKCHFQDQQQAETYINKMVSEGAIAAHVDHATGVVTLDDTQQCDSRPAAARGAVGPERPPVADQLSLAMGTKQLLSELNTVLMLEPAFVRRASKHCRKAAVVAGGAPHFLQSDAKGRFFEELADSDVAGLGI